MEYENLFKTFAIVLVGIFAYLGMIGVWNTAYGPVSMGDAYVGQTFNSTFNHSMTLAQDTLFVVGTGAANSTQEPDGPGTGDTNANLWSRALRVVTILPTMVDLASSLLNDVALLLGIPLLYVSIGAWVIFFSFAILFAYLLLIGVRRLL